MPSSSADAFPTPLDKGAISVAAIASLVVIGAIAVLVVSVLVNQNDLDLDQQRRTVTSLPDSGATPGTYFIPDVTVDSRGVVTRVTPSVAIQSLSAGSGLMGGTIVSGSGTVSVLPTGVAVGEYPFGTVTLNSRGQVVHVKEETVVNSIVLGPCLEGESADIQIKSSGVEFNQVFRSAALTVQEQGIVTHSAAGPSTQHGMVDARALPISVPFPKPFLNPPTLVEMRVSYAGRMLTVNSSNASQTSVPLSAAYRSLGSLRPKYFSFIEGGVVLDVWVTTTPVTRMHVLLTDATGSLWVATERVSGSRTFYAPENVVDCLDGKVVQACFSKSRSDLRVAVLFSTENSSQVNIVHKMHAKGFEWSEAELAFNVPDSSHVQAIDSISNTHGSIVVTVGTFNGVFMCVSEKEDSWTWEVPSQVLLVPDVFAVSSMERAVAIQSGHGEVTLISLSSPPTFRTVQTATGNIMFRSSKNVSSLVATNGDTLIAATDATTGALNIFSVSPQLDVVRHHLTEAGSDPKLTRSKNGTSLSYLSLDGHVTFQDTVQCPWSVGELVDLGEASSFGVTSSCGMSAHQEQEIIHIGHLGDVFGAAGQLHVHWTAEGVLM